MHYLILGLTLGLSAGVTPGPLLTLVIAASLRRGLSGGLRVALVPFITDMPIIALSLFLLHQLPSWALTAVAVAGGLLVIYLGVGTVRAARRIELPDQTKKLGTGGGELWQGVMVNMLNPNPYLFWATVGGPTLLTGWRQGAVYGVLFLLSFYALLVGSQAVVAWLVARQRQALTRAGYRRVLTVCGAVMMALGLMLIRGAWMTG